MNLQLLYFQFFEKKGVVDMKSGEDLFKSITGFEEIDVNLLEGVHTTYNALLSRFEIAPDDNRNVSYPFEYCWQKANEGKAKSDKSAEEDEDDDDEDKFEEMWTQSIKNKSIDKAADFGNEIHIKEGGSKEKVIQIVDSKINFAEELEVVIPKLDDISSTGKKF